MRKNIKSKVDAIKRLGLWNIVVGLIREPHLRHLCRKYGANEWYGVPIQLTDYRIEVARLTNHYIDGGYIKGNIADVGGGIGEISSHFKPRTNWGGSRICI